MMPNQHGAPGAGYPAQGAGGYPGQPGPLGHAGGQPGAGHHLAGRSDEAQPNLAAQVTLVQRVIARITDLIISWVLFLILLLPSSEVSVGHRGFWRQLPGFSQAPVIWSVVAGVVAFFAWEWGWTTQRGTTPGKQLVGAWVSRGHDSSPPATTETEADGAENDQREPGRFVPDDVPPGGVASAIRSSPKLIYGVPYLGFLAVIVDAVASLWFVNNDAQGRTALDRAAATGVVGSHPLPGRRNRLRSQGMWLLVCALGFVAATFAIWNFAHKPVVTAAETVLADIRDNNLAEATSSFAASCPVDRAAYATYFSENQIATFDLQSVDIDWAVPLFSEDQEQSRAVVSGVATIVGSSAGEQRVKIDMVREDEWRVCGFIE